jgi:RNA polymerase sigma factor (sigma-70 family)
MASDGTLLREYAQSGSEGAFAEIVRRHVDLVYSTALRAVGGDSHLAQDVSQGVFIDLARKAARLSDRSVLTGWLYKSACFAAAKAVRSERRRQDREQEAHAMQDHLTGPAQNSDWEQIGPVLNTVMLELGESDREVLLLRFFERRSLAEVGSQLGLSENAARMRLERALERLRRRLARRGVTSTAAGLALVLAHQAVSAAPVGLAASITAASLAGGVTASGSSILTLLAMTNAKAVIVGAAIAVGVLTPVVLQYQANGRLKAELAAAHRDTNAFLNGVSWDPQAKARADELFAGLPEAVQQKYGSVNGVMFDWLLNHATPMASYRVLSQSEQGSDDMTVLEQHQYTDERVRENTLQFHRDENGSWRQVIPRELMPKLANVINDLAGGPAATGTGK